MGSSVLWVYDDPRLAGFNWDQPGGILVLDSPLVTFRLKGSFLLYLKRNCEAELGSLVRNGIDLNFPSHELDEILADR